MVRVTALAALIAIAVVACATGTTPHLKPIEAQTVAVAQTLRIGLIPEGTDGTVAYSFDHPMLTGIERTASIVSTRMGAEFRWSPLAPHVGEHMFSFHLRSQTGGEILDTQQVRITVRPQADAGPIFTKPLSNGGTFDLDRNPSVTFDVEVRDDDSAMVMIKARGAMPDGATLMRTGNKAARFAWSPTPTQRASAERWTLQFEANDGSHMPTPRDYVVVLRAAPRDGCMGTPPQLTIVSPAEGSREQAGSGIPVRLTASDDASALRDTPIVYYTTVRPDDMSKPDVTRFEQLIAVQTAPGQYEARIPASALTATDEQSVYIVSSVTDDDDHMGTLCDHRTDTPVRTITAVVATRQPGSGPGPSPGTGPGTSGPGVSPGTGPDPFDGSGYVPGGGGSGGAGVCYPCSASRECASGYCAVAPSGGVCLSSCDVSSCSRGTCGGITTVEGYVASLCGNVDAVCSQTGGSGMCIEDGYEPNDDRYSASPISTGASGQVCYGNADFFSFAVAPSTRIDLTLNGTATGSDGDLDLQLLDEYSLLSSSARAGASESVSYCAPAGGTFYAQVFGYRSSSSASYSISVSQSSDSCCQNDGYEADSQSAPSYISGTSFDGTICPSDTDYRAFYVNGPSDVTVDMSFSHASGDLDISLLSPSGTSLSRSATYTDNEHLTVRVTETGYYTVRIVGYGVTSAPYSGWVSVVEGSTASCTYSWECPSGQVCSAGSCVSADCSSSGVCPTNHSCLPTGPWSTASCLPACASDYDCRYGETCKRLAEGRFCSATGPGDVGDSCSEHAHCKEDLSCFIAGSNGYCSRPCSTTSDCGTSQTCVYIGSAALCGRDCRDDASRCRTQDGVSCQYVQAVGATWSWEVCVP